MLDLTEETEIIELIEELKTKEVKYPRKGKGVRRKRSNTAKLVSFLLNHIFISPETIIW